MNRLLKQYISDLIDVKKRRSSRDRTSMRKVHCHDYPTLCQRLKSHYNKLNYYLVSLALWILLNKNSNIWMINSNCLIAQVWIFEPFEWFERCVLVRNHFIRTCKFICRFKLSSYKKYNWKWLLTVAKRISVFLLKK